MHYHSFHPKGDFLSWLSSNGKLEMAVTLCHHTHSLVGQRSDEEAVQCILAHMSWHTYNQGATAQVWQGASTRQWKKNGSWRGLSRAPRLLRTENSSGEYSALFSVQSAISKAWVLDPWQG